MRIQLDATKEYQDVCGKWHMPYVQNFKAGVSNWVLIPRTLGISVDKYVEMLINKYNAEVEYNDDYTYFGFKWTKKSDMIRYRNDMNKILKTKEIDLKN